MKLNEVYKNSGLGKWFHKQSATKEPGWDRYNSSGKRVGKCGDAKEGESYSACLSKQKARKLGKEGVGSFVKRKRAAQKEAGRGKKGSGAKGKKPIFVETGAAKKRKIEEQMNNINESCGCDKNKELIGKITNKVKNKLLKENVTPKFTTRPSKTVKECMDFTELDLSPFRGKKVLIETAEGDWYGTLGVIKNNFALLEDNEVKKVIDSTEITKVVCEDTKILILEKNKPNDPEKWSSCKSQAKAKFDVYPSAYANAWAAKCYKKKGGSWRSVKEDVEIQINNEAKKSSVLIKEDLLLQDRLKTVFFDNSVSEEIVNKDHKGKLTKDRQASRDKIKSKLKNVKVVKGPPGRMDTPEEAKYRLATYIEFKRGGKGKSKSKSDK